MAREFTQNVKFWYNLWGFSKLSLRPAWARSYYIIELLADVMKSEISAQGDRVWSSAHLTVHWQGSGLGIHEFEAPMRQPRIHDVPDRSLRRKRVVTTVANDMGEDAE